VDSRADLDAVAKKKKVLHYPYRESNPGRLARELKLGPSGTEFVPGFRNNSCMFLSC